MNNLEEGEDILTRIKSRIDQAENSKIRPTENYSIIKRIENNLQIDE